MQAQEILWLRRVVGAPCYVRNENFFRDFNFMPAKEVLPTKAIKQIERLEAHPNLLLRDLQNYHQQIREK